MFVSLFHLVGRQMLLVRQFFNTDTGNDELTH